MALRLAEYPHYRLKGSSECRFRIGDYRVIYEFDVEQNEIYVLAIEIRYTSGEIARRAAVYERSGAVGVLNWRRRERVRASRQNATSFSGRPTRFDCRGRR